MTHDYISPEEMRARGYDPATIAQGRIDEEARTEARTLTNDIENAFKGIPRPRITRHVARGYDDEWSLTEERVKELTALDPEQDWTEVDDDAIEQFQEYFTFSDPEGWQFYLPAHMRHYLRSFPQSSHDAVYWACTSGPDNLKLLTEEQLACVERFVSLCHKYQTP
jgi:hypothetical protein